MILILLTTIQIVLVLCLSQSEDFQRAVQFTLNVTDNGNDSKIPSTYDLRSNQNLSIQPNTHLSFYCSASDTSLAYVILAYTNRYNVTKKYNNTQELILQHDITNANCHDSGTFVCIAGDLNRTFEVNVPSDIIIKCPIDEIRFGSTNQYVAVSKNTVNITLICEENNHLNSLTLLNGRNRSHYLNYTERSHQITYYFPVMTCDDMGSYLCLINRSESPHRKEEKMLRISVNNCPPRIISDCDSDNEIINNNMFTSVILCVKVPINVTIIAVNYNGRWLESKNCNNDSCLQYSPHPSDSFRYRLNITFRQSNPKDGEDVVIKIGSGYNFRNNYINFTIKMNGSRRTIFPDQSKSTTKEARHQGSSGSDVAGSSSMSSNKGTSSIDGSIDTSRTPAAVASTGGDSGKVERTVFFVLFGILCFATVVTGFIAYRYRRKFPADRIRRISHRSRPRSRFKYLARCFLDGSANNDEDVYCNTKKTMKAVKRKSVVQKVDLGDEPSELFKKAQPNLYQKFRSKVRTPTPQTRSIESDNADSGEDSGRYLSDDGLIYVTLGSVNKKRRQKVCQRKRRRRKVKYAKLDYTKTGKFTIADDNCLYEDGDHVYQNVPAVPHVYQNVPAGQDIYQNVPAYV